MFPENALNDKQIRQYDSVIPIITEEVNRFIKDEDDRIFLIELACEAAINIIKNGYNIKFARMAISRNLRGHNNYLFQVIK